MERLTKLIREIGRWTKRSNVWLICGLAGATDGIRAVENRSIAGKIVVYPACKDLPLVPLEKMNEKMPQVAGCLNDGLWTRQAELKLLEMYENS